VYIKKILWQTELMDHIKRKNKIALLPSSKLKNMYLKGLDILRLVNSYWFHSENES